MPYVTAFQLAERFVGVREVKGVSDNHQIVAMLKLDDTWPTGDEVPWCSAFVNYVCWLLRLPRSRSLAARSWLSVGAPVEVKEAKVGFDVVVLSRGSKMGHVGFYAGQTDKSIWILGGNQDDEVNVREFPLSQLLGVRRLSHDV